MEIDGLELIGLMDCLYEHTDDSGKAVLDEVENIIYDLIDFLPREMTPQAAEAQKVVIYTLRRLKMI